MHIQPPDNPYEDGLITLLDRGIALDRGETEMQRIRHEMAWRQRCRLAEFRRLAKPKSGGEE